MRKPIRNAKPARAVRQADRAQTPEAIRRRLGLTLEDFARRVGVSYVTAWRWEHSVRPSRLARARLARVVQKARARISYRWKPHGAFADATPLRLKKARAPAWMIKQAIRSEKGCR